MIGLASRPAHGRVGCLPTWVDHMAHLVGRRGCRRMEAAFNLAIPKVEAAVVKEGGLSTAPYV